VIEVTEVHLFAYEEVPIMSDGKLGDPTAPAPTSSGSR
jgi:hypothetical protein